MNIFSIEFGLIFQFIICFPLNKVALKRSANISLCLNNFFISSSVLAIDNPPVLDMIEIDNVYRFIRTEL